MTATQESVHGAEPVARAAQLPVVLIAGYLGAGKTTLVNHLLRHAQGRRVAVLVNDFGSINIDAELIAANADDDLSAGVLSLAGGCLCCSFGDDLVGTLGALARRNPPPDVCLIELSGVALPASVARTARLSPTAEVVGTLVVADAEHIQRQAADRYVGDTVRQQLHQADWLLLNKPDLVAPAALQATAAWLQRTVPQARAWAGAVDAVWPELLLGWRDGADAAGGTPARVAPTATAVGAGLPQSHAADQAALASFAARPLSRRSTGAGHGDETFESCSFALAAHTDLRALGARLAAADSGVLRAKGLLAGCLLQVAAGRWAVTPARDDTSTPLVLIGLRGRWDPQRLMQGWCS